MATARSASTDRQKQLQAFVERRHPLYEAMEDHWEFLEATYKGGREWFHCNIHKYIKEGDKEYAERLARAYRFNHTREVVDLVDKYLFKMEIERDLSRAPPSVKTFWKSATLNKSEIDDFAKTISTKASIFGRVWVIVDNNRPQAVRTRAEEKKVKARTYAYTVAPYDVLDMSYDEMGELNWILVHEVSRDDEDPITSSGQLNDRYRLWTRTSSQLFEVQTDNKGRKTIVENPPVDHDLGEVPAVAVDNVISDELYESPALINDVAYLDRAVANYLSNLDAIIQDQTFSQLIMPAQGILPGEEGYNKLVEMGSKRLFTFDGEATYEPKYISPDPKQAEIILRVINKIINEIYHSVGLAGERTKEDNALGIDNSSGVAKAYDFERVNSLLASKAESIEKAENQIIRLVAKWNGDEDKLEKLEEELVEYPDNFDVRGLYDEFEIAARLALIEAPDTVRRAQMDSVVEKLFPQLKEDLKGAIETDLKSWPPKIDLMAPGAGKSPIQTVGKSALAGKLAGGGKKGAAI